MYIRASINIIALLKTLKTMRLLRYPLVIFFSFLTLASFCQHKKDGAKIKFGDVKPEDFTPTVYSLDSNANAIILADIGETKYEGGNHGDFNIVYNRITRIRLINKNGFDLASVQIPLYFGNNEEEMLSNFEAATYNIENGKVVATKVDKASLFKDKYDKNHTVRKFTFPNIKEGSIIEYKYTVSSPFYVYLDPWEFQTSTPCLWSEYQVTIPNDILDFVLTRKGYLPYAIDTSFDDGKQSYNILFPGDATEAAQVGVATSNTVTAHWAIKDIPALKKERFITSLSNYRSVIKFQLRRLKSPTHVTDYLGNWDQFVERLTKDDDFGVPISDRNGWLNDELKKITAGSANNLEKAHKVYNYIRDNFSCLSDDGYKTTKPLKKVFQDKNGTVGDINLLLVAALKNAGLDATPALLSTRSNGIASEIYPLIEQYNYVICDVKIDGRDYTLDATNKWAGFGKLDEELYNGSARLIAPVPSLVPLVADSLKESKVTTVFMMNDEDGKGLSASFTSRLGEHEGMDFRGMMSKKTQEEYFKGQKKAFGFETTISDTEIDSLNQPDEPVTVKYSFTLKPEEDIIYLSPLLTEAQKENPFKAAERLFPVEMPYCTDETYVLNMEVPKGYKVEEMPKSARVKLNDDDGMFEYVIAASGNRIQLRCRVSIKKATFLPEDYQTLRDFYGFIVKKEAEQIVLKKI